MSCSVQLYCRTLASSTSFTGGKSMMSGWLTSPRSLVMRGWAPQSSLKALMSSLNAGSDPSFAYLPRIPWMMPLPLRRFAKWGGTLMIWLDEQVCLNLRQHLVSRCSRTTRHTHCTVRRRIVQIINIGVLQLIQHLLREKFRRWRLLPPFPLLSMSSSRLSRLRTIKALRRSILARRASPRTLRLPRIEHT